MMSNIRFLLTLVAALGCGIMAGVFFAFSSFVMAALAKRPAPEGIAAMQAINITVINPLFMLVFLGTAAVCLFLAIVSLFKWHQSGSVSGAIYLLVGSLLYLMGTFGITIVGNVPLNDALAVVNPTSSEGAAVWANYLVTWTLWNHIRTIAAIAATATLMRSLVERISLGVAL